MCTQALAVQTIGGQNEIANNGEWLGSRLLWWGGEAIAYFILSRAVRKARAELHALDDRMLDDIGIQRSEIDRVLQQTARQRNSWSLLPPGRVSSCR